MTMEQSVTGPIGRVWQKVADREAARVRDSFLQGRDGVQTSRAALVLLLTALTVIGYVAITLMGVRLLAWAFGLFGLGPTNPFRVMVGLMAALPLLWFSVNAFPRFGKQPGVTVSAAQAPEFHRLIDEVALALNTAAPERVVVTPDVNAFMGRESVRQRPVLGLGLPLWFGLQPQERVAIIAHELAHQRNGDPARTGVVAVALTMLRHAVYLLSPAYAQASSLGLGQLIVQACMWVVHLVPLGLYTALVNAVGPEHQAAEYRADLMAARVAGTAAAVTALDKVHMDSALEHALHKQRHFPERPHAYLELRHIWDNVPEEKWRQQRSENAERRVRLDDTHPPTADRLMVLQATPSAPQLVLTPERAARIDAELSPLVRPFAELPYVAYRRRSPQ